MKIVILGAGPAGLYCGLLIKKANPTHDITILERNPADVTYGWGVVFSDRTLSSFQRADAKTYEQITNHFVIWDAIDVHYRNETIRCGGHIIASIARKQLLSILQQRCAELGVTLRFNCEVQQLSQLSDYDLLISADGINSLVRKTHTVFFKPSIELGKAKYIWLGTNKVLDAFTFLFRENECGLFQVHAYPSSGASSTFIVECDETTWHKAGLDTATEQESLAYCERLFAPDLNGASLLSNNSKWINFPTLKTQTWHYQQMVLLGDAAHTAHFSIGSGTKLAMEDAIALASALEQHATLETALNQYELERKPVVETFQRAASESRVYFETIKRYLNLEPMQFTFQLLTRSGRISYDDLKLRDARFGDTFDRWYTVRAQFIAPLEQLPSGESFIAPPEYTVRAQFIAPLEQIPLPSINALRASETQMLGKNVFIAPSDAPNRGRNELRPYLLLGPPPLFAPFSLRNIHLSNRLVVQLRNLPGSNTPVKDGMPNDHYAAHTNTLARSGLGLIMLGPAAISAEARITPEDVGIYSETHGAAWAKIVQNIHAHSSTKVALQLSHAGRRGSTRSREAGLDRPLRHNNWPLLSASPLPYTVQSQVPKEIERSAMDTIRNDFVHSAHMAQEASFDLLQLHIAHGYLLASFLSPLTNNRNDEYGSSLEGRMRFPLEVFDAVRAVWPNDKPLLVALSASDYIKGGFDIEEAVLVARTLQEHGCDMIEVLAGQTTPASEPPYGRSFLTPFSDRIRNEAGIPTMVGGYLTTSNEVNTILAAGRADLCILEFVGAQ